MYRLKRQILAISLADGLRHADYIPEGSIVNVLGGPRPDDKRLVDVRWENSDYAVFFVDLEARAEEVKTTGA